MDLVDLEQRAHRAEQSLRDLARDLALLQEAADAADPEAARELTTRAAGFGVANAVPLSAGGDAPADRAALLTQAAAIARELTRRVDQITALAASFDAAAATDGARRDAAVARLRVVFGRTWVVVPRFKAANADELAEALADSTRLQGGDPLASTTWFQRTARVREGTARLHAALTYAEALDTGEPLALTLAQLPHAARDRWAGLPLRPGTSLPGGKLSLAVQSATPVDTRRSLAGLLLDEWVEVVPSATETSGISFQYDQPNAAPPQAILIAVPPEPGTPWTLWSLQQVLLEALDLARIRAVDPDALGEIGHFLPALFVACNTAGDTVATDFTQIR